MVPKLGRLKTIQRLSDNCQMGQEAHERNISPIKELRKVKKGLIWFQTMHTDISSLMVIPFLFIILHHLLYFQQIPTTPCTFHQRNTSLEVSIGTVRRLKEIGFLPIPKTLSELMSKLLNANLITQMQSRPIPNPSPWSQNLNLWCAYHMGSPGHHIDECCPLKNKMQDLIDFQTPSQLTPQHP